MTLELTPELEAALAELARRWGVTPEVAALDVLRERFLSAKTRFDQGFEEPKPSGEES